MRANSASDFRRLLAARSADAETKHPPSRIGNGEGGFRPLAAPGAFRRITNLPVGALDWPDRRNGVHALFPQTGGSTIPGCGPIGDSLLGKPVQDARRGSRTAVSGVAGRVDGPRPVAGENSSPARGSLIDKEEKLVRCPIHLESAVKVHSLAVPVIVEVSALDCVPGAVGIEQADALTLRPADALVDDAV